MNTKNNNARAVISQHTLVSPQVADAKADLLREVVESVIDEMIVVAGRQDEIFEEWTSENRAIIDGWQCRIADAISAAPPAADRATAPASDIGILLSALRNHEDATGEDFDDESGVIAQIERDYLAGIVTSHEVVPVDRAAVIEECALAAQTEFTRSIDQFVLIGPGGLASHMVNAIRALANHQPKEQK